MKTTIEKAKEIVSEKGCAIYKSGTPEYDVFNELTDEDMDSFIDWISETGYELRYRNDEDVFIVC